MRGQTRKRKPSKLHRQAVGLYDAGMLLISHLYAKKPVMVVDGMLVVASKAGHFEVSSATLERLEKAGHIDLSGETPALTPAGVLAAIGWANQVRALKKVKPIRND